MTQNQVWNAGVVMIYKKITASVSTILYSGLLLISCSSYQPSLGAERAQYTAVKNGRIEYYQIGYGSPIVLIPGFATDVSSWSRRFLAHLAAQHRLIVLNNRNVAGSLIHSSQYTSKDLAHDVSQLIQDLHLQKPAVLGISMGGMIAQQVAISYPENVGALILINTIMAGHESVKPSPAMEKTLRNLPEDDLGFYWVAVNTFFPANWKLDMAFTLVFDRFEPRNFTAINRQAVLAQQRQLILNWVADDKSAEKLAQLNVPTLILNGQADVVIPPVNSCLLACAIPHAKLVRWQEGGHAMVFQFPESLAQVINNFLAKY
jgi:pimeloyl-ACP methyl ester carboxylesterase